MMTINHLGSGTMIFKISADRFGADWGLFFVSFSDGSNLQVMMLSSSDY